MDDTDAPDEGKGGHSRQDTGTGSGDDRLAVHLSELAHELQQQEDLQSTLDTIVRAAVDQVPGAQHASICRIVARRDVRTEASTSDLASAVDQAQYDTGQGPCLDTLYAEHTVRIDDMRAEGRWPHFVARARDLGAQSMLAVQLFVEEEGLGALNLISEGAGAFTDGSEHVALLLASHASVAISAASKEEQLLAAMDTRDVIGKAIGIVMERYDVDQDRAFDLLTGISQHSNRRMSDLAVKLVANHDLPGAHPGARSSARPTG